MKILHHLKNCIFPVFWFHSNQVLDVSYASHEPTVEVAVDWLHVHQTCFKPPESAVFPRADGACSPGRCGKQDLAWIPTIPTLSGNHLMVAEGEAHPRGPAQRLLPVPWHFTLLVRSQAPNSLPLQEQPSVTRSRH